MLPGLEENPQAELNYANVPTLKRLIMFNMEEEITNVTNFDTLFNAGGSAEKAILDQTIIDPHSPINVQFTSGTTGRPKAAALTHFAIVNNARSIVEMGNKYCTGDEVKMADENTILINNLPLYHVFSFTSGAILGCYAKATNVFPAPGFSAMASLNAIDMFKGTLCLYTPTMMLDLVNHEDFDEFDTSSVAYQFAGGAPVTPELVRIAKQKMPNSRTLIGYGMTENTCASCVVWPGAPDDVTLYSVGKPLAHLEVRIADDKGNVLPQGEIGEVNVRGYTVFPGYVKDPEKTAENFHPENWWRTGDLGRIEDDIVKLEGRSKDMIIRGGENIQPTEIENYINEHPDVESCYVIGVPSRRLGEEVAAYIRMHEDKEISVEDMKEYAATGLARYKVPKFIKYVTEYPLTNTGKVQKFKLRDGAAEDFTLDN